jgi:UDP-2,4-diacetamido-2,4,6-trideoxy-beta-L-altropyranose hydrolase
MRCLLVTEGGHEAGSGHLVRNRALYEALCEQAVQTSFLVNPSLMATRLLRDLPHQTLDWHQNWEGLAECVRGIDRVVVDSYLAPTQLLDRLAHVTPCLFIDDWQRHIYARGVVMNGAPHAQGLSYPQQEGVRYWLGPQYALLRRPFWNVGTKLIRGQLEQLLITLGGSDPRSVTGRLVERLVKAFPQLEKWVVVGADCHGAAAIRSVADSRTHLVEQADAAQMLQLMLQADLAISAGGQTLHELARVGTPTLMLGVAENQRQAIGDYAQRGLMDWIGWWDDGAWPDQMVIAINRMVDPLLRGQKSESLRRLFDGQGARRVAQGLLSDHFVTC